jgi:hypothetical protein
MNPAWDDHLQKRRIQGLKFVKFVAIELSERRKVANPAVKFTKFVAFERGQRRIRRLKFVKFVAFATAGSPLG